MKHFALVVALLSALSYNNVEAYSAERIGKGLRTKVKNYPQLNSCASAITKGRKALTDCLNKSGLNWEGWSVDQAYLGDGVPFYGKKCDQDANAFGYAESNNSAYLLWTTIPDEYKPDFQELAARLSKETGIKLKYLKGLDTCADKVANGDDDCTDDYLRKVYRNYGGGSYIQRPGINNLDDAVDAFKDHVPEEARYIGGYSKDNVAMLYFIG